MIWPDWCRMTAADGAAPNRRLDGAADGRDDAARLDAGSRFGAGPAGERLARLSGAARRPATRPFRIAVPPAFHRQADHRGQADARTAAAGLPSVDNRAAPGLAA